MPAARTVSVVVPTLNGGDEFRACLDAIHAQVLDRPFDVLVIDSGSSDGTLERCREHGVRLISIDKRDFNHGATRNQAIAATTGDYVALLTQDAVPIGTGWLQSFVDALDAHPEAAGAYGRQVLRDTTLNPYQRWRLEGWSATRTERVVQAIRDRDAFEASTPLEKLALAAFDDVNACVRRVVWESIPYAPLEFGEDIDWGLRVLRAGHSIVFEPEARVLHSHNDSLWKDFRRVYADHRNLNRLFGMRQIPRAGDVWRCTVSGVGHLWKSVPLDRLPMTRRLYWRLYAVPWTLAQNAAQHLGARANERGSTPPWSWIDGVARSG